MVLQHALCRFGVVRLESREEEYLLSWLSFGLKLSLAQLGVGELDSFLDDTDRHRATKAYLTRLNSNPPLLPFSLILFDWATNPMDSIEPELNFAFLRASYLRLWAAFDAAGNDWPPKMDRMACAIEYAQHLTEETR